MLDGNVENAKVMFLDDKPQRLDIDGKPHIFQFVEQFRTLLINRHPFRTDFGGNPMVVYVNHVMHYLRLTALPRGVKVGQPMKTREEVFKETTTAQAAQPLLPTAQPGNCPAEGPPSL